MPETKSKFLSKLIEDKETAPSFTSERQPTAQALVLHVDYRDGLSSEGATWSHLVRYKWRDMGDHERLRIIFGPMCIMEILGHNLVPLIAKLREGQLNGIFEALTSQTALVVAEGGADTIISSVTAYPDFDTLFEEIREEAKEDEKNAAKGGFIRRLER